MTPDHAVDLMRSALVLSLLIGAPALLTAIVVGLVISLLQAVTQLQDQTLSFVPKIIAMMVVMLYTLPWVLNEIVEYSQDVFQEIPRAL
jgi:flagellar biosynthesis protein FliQ